MHQLRAFLHRLRGFFNASRFGKDIAAELEAHVQLHTDAGLRQGLAPAEARRQALIRLGGVEQVRQAQRERNTLPWVETLWHDLRFGARMIAHNPTFAAVAAGTLALGIGASTAIFSTVKPILIDSLPYSHPSRLMSLMELRRSGRPLLVNFCTFQGLSQQSHSFDSLAVFKPWQAAATSDGLGARPERIEGQRVSAGYFRTLGIAPVLGRDFQASDDRFRGPNAVILSNRLWRRRFAGDPALVGSQIRLDDQLYTVIGIMPGSFENLEDPQAQIWSPLQYNPALPEDGREWGHHLQMIARLKPGVSREQAVSELRVVVHALAQTYAKGYDSAGGPPDSMAVTSMQRNLTEAVRPALLAVLGAVVLVLLIACVNLANLLLARGSQRRAEFAMRAALGAPHGRIARQLITESLMLALLGGALGLFVAEAGVKALVLLSPPALPRLSAIAVDGSVFSFALLLTTFIGVAVGMVSAAQAGRRDLQTWLLQGSGRATPRRRWMSQVLVVAEVSLAVVLLVSTGLLLRSMLRLAAVDPGFNADGVLTMQVQESGRPFATDAARLEFYNQALGNIRRLPGVTSAGITSQLPLNGDQDVYGIEFESDNRPTGEGAFRYSISPGYLESMQIPLLRGRRLDQRDAAGAPVAVLISESLAERKYPGKDPLGQHVRVGPDAGNPNQPWATIVGVVGNIKQESLAVGPEDAFYVSTAQWVWIDPVQSLVVRTAVRTAMRMALRTHADAGAAQLAPAVQQAIWSVDKDRPVDRVATMAALLAATAQERRFVLILFETFGGVALLLAAIGIYGVLSGSVAERTREMGVRAALGATRANILAHVLRQGMTMSAIGVALGLCAALATARALSALLFGISWLDRPTYLAATSLLLLVAAIACIIPARRAASVDPMQALRGD